MVKINISEYQKKFYDKLGPYGKIDFSRINAVLKFLKNKKGKLLDVGCGDGIISKLFMEKGFDLTGIEISDNAIALAKKRGVHVKKVDITKKLSFKSETFDVVFCGELLEHLLDPLSLLKELRRVLKENGTLVITIPNISTIRNAILILFGSMPSYSCLFDGPHVRDYNPKEATRLLRMAGFDKNKIYIRGSHITFPIWRKTLIKLPPFIKGYSDYLIIKAVK